MKQFESKNIYLHWLYYRHAMPMRLNRVLVKMQWAAAAVFIFLWLDPNGWQSPLLGLTEHYLPIMIILSGLFYFLFCAPLSIDNDMHSGHARYIFVSQVPTGEIVANLRAYFLRQHLALAFPCIVLVIIMLLWPGSVIDFRRLEFGNVIRLSERILFIALAWWFVLESGIATAGLPRIMYSSGLILIIWIMPVFLIMLVTSVVITTLDQYALLRPIIINNRGFGLDQGEIFIIYMNIFLIIVTVTARKLSYRFMALKRAGYWGA